MVYLLQKHKRKLGREVEDLKTFTKRVIHAQCNAVAQRVALAQRKEVKCA